MALLCRRAQLYLREMCHNALERMQTEVIEKSIARMIEECSQLLQSVSDTSIDVHVRDVIKRNNWAFDVQSTVDKIKSQKRKRMAKLLISLQKALDSGRMTPEQSRQFQSLRESLGKNS